MMPPVQVASTMEMPKAHWPVWMSVWNPSPFHLLQQWNSKFPGFSVSWLTMAWQSGTEAESSHVALNRLLFSHSFRGISNG